MGRAVAVWKPHLREGLEQRDAMDIELGAGRALRLRSGGREWRSSSFFSRSVLFGGCPIPGATGSYCRSDGNGHGAEGTCRRADPSAQCHRPIEGHHARRRVAIISDAGIYAPNTYFSEFSARKLSFPAFPRHQLRSGQSGDHTYIDGVPQLHTNASSIDLVDVDQIELVRGAQSALFGRNALGGLVNIASARPSLTKWSGGLSHSRSATSARERCAAPPPGRSSPGTRLQRVRRARRARRLHEKRSHRQADRQSIDDPWQSAAALDTGRQLGSACDRQQRTGSRRRLRAERSGQPAAEPVPCLT